MSGREFIIVIVILYIIYYVGNIIYDIYFNKKNISDNLSSNDLDVSSFIEDEYIHFVQEENNTQEIKKHDKEQDVEEQEVIEEQEENDKQEIIEDVIIDIDNSEIANVTYHGGYQMIELKELLSEIDNLGENPLLTVTSKM